MRNKRLEFFLTMPFLFLFMILMLPLELLVAEAAEED